VGILDSLRETNENKAAFGFGMNSENKNLGRKRNSEEPKKIMGGINVWDEINIKSFTGNPCFQ